jgi:hypothetical protein
MGMVFLDVLHPIGYNYVINEIDKMQCLPFML